MMRLPFSTGDMPVIGDIFDWTLTNAERTKSPTVFE